MSAETIHDVATQEGRDLHRSIRRRRRTGPRHTDVRLPDRLGDDVVVIRSALRTLGE